MEIAWETERAMLRIMLVIGFFTLTSSPAFAACEEYRVGSSAWWDCMEADFGRARLKSFQEPNRTDLPRMTPGPWIAAMRGDLGAGLD